MNFLFTHPRLNSPKLGVQNGLKDGIGGQTVRTVTGTVEGQTGSEKDFKTKLGQITEKIQKSDVGVKENLFQFEIALCLTEEAGVNGHQERDTVDVIEDRGRTDRGTSVRERTEGQKRVCESRHVRQDGLVQSEVLNRDFEYKGTPQTSRGPGRRNRGVVSIPVNGGSKDGQN